MNNSSLSSSLFVHCLSQSTRDIFFSKNELSKDYDEQKVIDYMKNESIEITVDIGIGKKNFTSYTMDLTKDYIEINADYRS